MMDLDEALKLGTECSPHESPRRNGEETAKTLLLSRMFWLGFRQAGTGGGSLKKMPFFTEFQAGTAAESRGSRARRAGQKTVRPRTGGRAAEMGSSEKAGFKLFTETTSVLEAEVFIPSLQDPIRSTIQRSQRGNRGILVHKNKFHHQQSRWKLVRWRRSNMMRQRDGESNCSVLNLAEERCQKQLRASEEHSRNSQRGTVNSLGDRDQNHP